LVEANAVPAVAPAVTAQAANGTPTRATTRRIKVLSLRRGSVVRQPLCLGA
jgi:hypothetical protein